MKYVRSLLLALLFVASPALAQWQTPVHSVPVGKGGGNVGFSYVPPGTAGLPLLSAGAGADPAYGVLGVSGGGTGQASIAAAFAALAPTASAPGTVIYWNGTAWVALTGNSVGTQCLTENASGVPAWASCSGNSSANPTASVGLSPVNGAASTFMRSDAAPPLSQSIAPVWTGLHKFTAFPIILGSAAATDSDPVMEITRAFDNTGSGNGHGYADLTVATRTNGGPIGYNSFDAATTYGGTNSFDHYASFQARPIIGTSATTNIVYGFASLPQVNTGSVTTLNHVEVFDASGSGSVTTQYGLRILALSKATTNWAVYTEGTTPSKFGGNVDVGGLSVAGVDATGVWTSWTPTFTPSATPTGFTTSVARGYYKRLGKVVWFYVMGTVSANGTGAGVLQATLPIATTSKANNIIAPLYGLKSGSLALTGTLSIGSTTASIVKYDGTYPVTTGDSVYFAGHYEID